MFPRLLICVVVGLLLTSRLGLCQTRPAKGIPKPVATVLTWLPADTESVLVAKGPLPEKPKVAPAGVDVVTEFDGRSARTTYIDRATGREVTPPPVSPDPPFAAFMAQVNIGLFGEIRGENDESLEIPRVSWTVKAGRKFGQIERIPSVVSYQGCDLAILEKDVPVTLIEGIKRQSSRTTQAGGFTIYHLVTKHGKEEIPQYFANPAANVVVTTTNLEFVDSLLKRVESRPTDLAFPPDLPEWKYADTSAPSWGIRHFRKRTADADAKGMTFSVAPNDSAIVFHYISRSAMRSKMFDMLLDDMFGEDAPRVRNTSADAAQATWPIKENYGETEAALVTLWLMGWAVGL